MSEIQNAEAPPSGSHGQNGGETTSAANLDSNAFARLLVKKEQAKAEAAQPTADDPATPPQEESAPPAEEANETQSEAESQATEEKSEEAKEEADDVLSPESKKLDPKTQAILNKRIGREVGKTKREIAARAKVEAERDHLKAQLEAIKGGTPQAQATPQALPEITDLAALEQHESEAKRTIRWIDAQLDRDDFPAEGIKTDDGILTKSALKQIRMNARVALEDQIPAQRKFIQDKEAARAKAHADFPELADPESETYAEAQAAFRANPWLRNLPNADWIVGIQLLGLKALKEKQEAAKKPNKATKPTPKPMNGQTTVASDASPSRVPAGSGGAAQISALSQQLRQKNGASEKDFAAYLKQREILKFS